MTVKEELNLENVEHSPQSRTSIWPIICSSTSGVNYRYQSSTIEKENEQEK